MRTSLEDKYLLLRNALGDSQEFTLSDAASVLDIKYTSLKWVLHTLKRSGSLVSRGKGVYAFPSGDTSARPKAVHVLAGTAATVREILEGEGVDFVISGIDAIRPFLHHIPERYPMLVWVQGDNLESAQWALQSQDIPAVTQNSKLDYEAAGQLPLDQYVMLRMSEELGYSQDHVAEPERAFVDMYYEITRVGYPLSLYELARIYVNMRRQGAVNVTRMTKYASRRSLERDIRYIIDHDRITESAKKLATLVDETANEPH